MTVLARFFKVPPRRWLRRGLIAGGTAFVLVLALWIGGEVWIRAESSGRVYGESAVPDAPVALVLGAQVYPDGQPSPFLAARLDLAKRLLDDGKVKALLVSGDHGAWAYDEPGSMQVYLIAHGVPADRIALDYAGFDTYDSCARASRIFGVTKAIVVTQQFHIDRAVALCEDQGIQTYGVADTTVRTYKEVWDRAVVRERGAAVKAAVDALSHRDPVYLGRHETTVESAVRAAG